MHMPVLIARTVITFVLVLVVVRWTGKRSVANLAPFDLALVILIGEVSAIPVADLKVDLMHGILPVALIGGLHVLMTTINLHSKAFERWTEGLPTQLIKDGKVLKQNLRKERVSMIDLESVLRLKEINHPSKVKEAWMEPAGGVSIRLKEEEEPASSRELEQAVALIVQANSAKLRQELRELLERHGKSGG